MPSLREMQPINGALGQAKDPRQIPLGSSGDHLSAQYHEALCRIGAKMFMLALS